LLGKQEPYLQVQLQTDIRLQILSTDFFNLSLSLWLIVLLWHPARRLK
jgi:hypothetical protein